MTAIFDALSEPIATRVTAGLAKIGLVLKSRAWKGAGAAGVTPTQAQAIALLREAPKGMRLGALASLLGVSPPTASDTVKSLVAKGLAAKDPGPDKRTMALRLTPEGETMADRTAEWPSFLARAVDALGPVEQTAFLRSLVKIIARFRRTATSRPSACASLAASSALFAHPDELAPHHCAYVDAPFGDRHLRLNCAEQEDAAPEWKHAAWERFSGGFADFSMIAGSSLLSPREAP
jgi:DNA-binding MarR family transcriptional regulator